jgi:hypothetical protein
VRLNPGTRTNTGILLYFGKRAYETIIPNPAAIQVDGFYNLHMDAKRHLFYLRL